MISSLNIFQHILPIKLPHFLVRFLAYTCYDRYITKFSSLFSLVDNGDFKMFGPKTLIHYKTDDKILVYVRPDTIHIIHDGECVIDNFSINYFNFHPSEVDETILNQYLQDILHHF